MNKKSLLEYIKRTENMQKSIYLNDMTDPEADSESQPEEEEEYI